MRLPSLLLSSLLFTLAAQAPATAQTASDPAAAKIETREKQWRSDLGKEVRDDWNAGNYMALEKMGEDFVKHPAKSYSGKPKLASFMYFIGETLQINWKDTRPKTDGDCHCDKADPAQYAEAEKAWDEIDVRLQAWAHDYPHSLVLPLVRARFLEKRAWFYRGGGYASKVNDAAWPLFKRYIEESSDILKANASLRFKNPEWYEQAAELAVVTDWPEAERSKFYADMVKRIPAYVPAFASAAQFLQPQWGGDYQAIDGLIRSAQKRHSKKDGLEFYARVYWWYLSGINKHAEAPKQIAADWNIIKEGLDIMLERYPDRLNYYGAALMACKYQDYDYFDSLTRRMGTSELYRTYPLDHLDCNRPDAEFFSFVGDQPPVPHKPFVPQIPGMPVPPANARPPGAPPEPAAQPAPPVPPASSAPAAAH